MSDAARNVFISHREQIPESPADYTELSQTIIQEMLAEALAGLGISRQQVQNRRVMLKPNLVRPNLPVQPTVSTDPRVVLGLCLIFKEWGARVVVGENPGYGYPARAAFRSGGLYWALKHLGIEMSFFDEEEIVRVENPRGVLLRWIHAARSLVESELLINVPKLKTHMHTMVSVCFKNLQGVLLDPQRRLFHREDLQQKIVDTAAAFIPWLNVVDGIWAMEGQAPFFGNSITDCNTIIVGQDMLATDLAAVTLMGIAPHEVSHLRIAAASGFGDLTLGPSQLLGWPLDPIKRQFVRPVINSTGVYPGIDVIEAGACSGCLSSLRHSLDRLNFEDRLPQLGECTVYVGKPMPNSATLRCWRGDLWLFGNCAVDLVFSHPSRRLTPRFVQGCPPHVLDFYTQAKDDEKPPEK